MDLALAVTVVSATAAVIGAIVAIIQLLEQKKAGRK
jgi:hypothetical protein